MIHEKLLIDGRWTDVASGDIIEVRNPATGEAFASVPAAGEMEVDMAVAAADRAFAQWSRLTPLQRGVFLCKAGELAERRALDIARLMTQEQGKPLPEALGEVRKGAQILAYYAEEGKRVHGRIIPNAEPDMESRVIYQPVGVAVAISPWNYPVELLAWKLGCSLAAGCTVVCKLPSETPLSPLAFVRCLIDVGLPAGVVKRADGTGLAAGPAAAEESAGKKGGVYGVDRSWEADHGRMRVYAEEGVAGTGRQPADGGVSGLRYRRGGGRCGAAVLSEHGADLHRRQPDLCGQRDLSAVFSRSLSGLPKS